MCKGTLWVDPASGKVVDHKTAEQQKATFDEFLKAQKKGTAWDEKFKKAKEEEAKRKAEIEQKFKEAQESEEPVEKPPLQSPFDWD